jgi:hypothetical protein
MMLPHHHFAQILGEAACLRPNQNAVRPDSKHSKCGLDANEEGQPINPTKDGKLRALTANIGSRPVSSVRVAFFGQRSPGVAARTHSPTHSVVGIMAWYRPKGTSGWKPGAYGRQFNRNPVGLEETSIASAPHTPFARIGTSSSSAETDLDADESYQSICRLAERRAVRT